MSDLADELSELATEHENDGMPDLAKTLRTAAVHIRSAEAEIAGYQLRHGPLSTRLWRGECGHHWIIDEASQCPLCKLDSLQRTYDDLLAASRMEGYEMLKDEYREHIQSLESRLHQLQELLDREYARGDELFSEVNALRHTCDAQSSRLGHARKYLEDVLKRENYSGSDKTAVAACALNELSGAVSHKECREGACEICGPAGEGGREVACLGGCGRTVPEAHASGIVTSWRCSSCSPDGHSAGTVQMPSAPVGEGLAQHDIYTEPCTSGRIIRCYNCDLYACSPPWTAENVQQDPKLGRCSQCQLCGGSPCACPAEAHDPLAERETYRNNLRERLCGITDAHKGKDSEE